MIPHRIPLVLAIICSLPALAGAQPTTMQTSSGPVTLANTRFENPAAGISFRPPAGMHEVRGGSLGSSEVVRYENKDKKWVIIVTSITLDSKKPLPLTSWKDEQNRMQPGMLEVAIEQFKTANPGATILREFPDDSRLPQIGFLAAKFNSGLDTNLVQEAIIRASNLRYYIISFTSPAPKDGELEDSPAIMDAKTAFDQMVKTVELTDLTEVRQDQEERLFRTRNLFLGFTPAKVRSSLEGEQWFRFIQDGKDVGYSYVIQQVARDLPRKGKPEVQSGPEGVLVGIRSRLLPEPGVQTDAESWYFMTFDRRFESFSSVVYGQKTGSAGTTTGEVGISRRREKPIPVGGPLGSKEMIQTDDYRLEVTRIGRNKTDPVERELPPYYMPLSLYQLLPRMLPHNEPKTYLFASWITEVGEVVHRYIDVGREQDVNLAGKRVRAIPIKDKIGLQGSVTTHYVTIAGKYLGSVNEDSSMIVLSTDEEALRAKWKDADLTRPGDVDQKR